MADLFKHSILLRPVSSADYPVLFGLRRDIELQSLLLTVSDSDDDASLRAWIERRINDNGGTFQVLAAGAAGTAIGFIQVSGVHRRNGTGNGGICLVEGARNKGFGRLGLERLIEYSREELGLRKLMAEIRIGNTASLRLHEAAGYRLVGTFEKHFIDHKGANHDVHVMEKMIALDGPA